MIRMRILALPRQNRPMGTMGTYHRIVEEEEEEDPEEEKVSTLTVILDE